MPYEFFSGRLVLLEKHLNGPELSLFSLVDGGHVRPLLAAQDFKRAYDDDRGPNTGGWGRCACAVGLGKLVDRIVQEIVQPFVGELVVAQPLIAACSTPDWPSPTTAHTSWSSIADSATPTQSVLALLRTPLAQLLYATAVGRLERRLTSSGIRAPR